MRIPRNWVIFWVVAFVVTVSLLFVVHLDRQLTPPYIVTVYDSADVIRICNLFQISLEDEFCANPQIQTANTFDEALYRNFPRGDTYHSQIYAFINQLEMRPSTGCLNNPRYAIGNCPPPEECSGRRSYQCYVSFREAAPSIEQLTLYFDANGFITRYGALRPPESVLPTATLMVETGTKKIELI